MLVKATAIVKFSGIYKWDIINPLKDCLKNGKPIKNEQLGYECNVFDLFIHDATKAFINCGAYGKGRIYHLEYTKLADSERGRL